MAMHFLRITFYGREDAIHIAIKDADSEDVLEGMKGLAAGRKDIPAFYLFPISESHSALLSLTEIQSLQVTGRPNGGPPQLTGGADFYIRGHGEPLSLDYSGQGPLDDMFHGLATTQHEDEVPGWVMLTDGHGEPVFFRLDEIQYAFVRTELIQKPS